ncbi:MAG: hypothetical protein BGO21_00150 [Dyadobacter sp. 50-39]|uniref:DUF4838 domain-containing protein n=1 Tax=Dyadobacter sp. 50-39 TaxID=1895756 RepID=UPI00095EF2D6|nr:DUF4838 domain-containing protein [Dyadobacter sp. 50-39]OJV15153.1 MAG: hypothetical protein BGO21_00150 [Dyadobacter sp. 50-39]
MEDRFRFEVFSVTILLVASLLIINMVKVGGFFRSKECYKIPVLALHNWLGNHEHTANSDLERINESYWVNEREVDQKVKIQPSVSVQSYSFEYREPYFPDNSDANYRKRNKTNLLETDWGIWGHNLEKIVPLDQETGARFSNEVVKSQFCFSSEVLFNKLDIYIGKLSSESFRSLRFMIAANDNRIVCHCNSCKAKGNTTKNASPAVFHLINKLAKKHPQHQFFGLGYLTTESPPPFKMEANAGVMLSTMPFPKGVVISKTSSAPRLDDLLKSWKRVTKKIYIWDYAVNFDNYMEPYPCLFIIQENLRHFQSMGVTGVFVQGSGENYSAFQDIKCFIISRLLVDVDIDISKEISLFLGQKYPKEIADEIYRYYSLIEGKSFVSTKTMDIYGGIEQAREKYLNDDDFREFYRGIREKVYSGVCENELKRLRLSTAFMCLELSRTGKRYLDRKKMNVSVNSEPYETSNSLLTHLQDLSAETSMDVISEGGRSIHGYIKEWKSDGILNQSGKISWPVKLTSTSKLDPDYARVSDLQDGRVGFSDYFNNWLINSSEQLIVSSSVTTEMIAKDVSIGFLQDPAHRIHFPTRVEMRFPEQNLTLHPKDIKFSSTGTKRYYIFQIAKTVKTGSPILFCFWNDHSKEGRTIAADEILISL